MDLLLQQIINIMTYIAICWIVSAALNFEYGFTGIPNLGMYLSVAGGAYVAGYLPGRLLMAIYLQDTELDYITNNIQVVTLINLKLRGDPVAASLVFALTFATVIAVGACLGFISTYPAIRLSDAHLMMTLIAMGEAAKLIGNYYTPIAGGPFGVQMPNLLIGWGKFSIIPILIASVVTILLMQLILSSPFGRLIRAIREDETTAESLGKNVNAIKMKVIILCSILGSIAGFLFALQSGAVVASVYDRGTWTFWPWLMMMIGGIGNNLGCFIGCVLIITMKRMLIIQKHIFEPFLPFRVIWFEPMLLAVFLLIVMIFRPQGIFPEKIKASHIRGLSDFKILKKQEQQKE